MIPRPSNVLVEPPCEAGDARAEGDGERASFVAVSLSVGEEPVNWLREATGRSPDTVRVVRAVASDAPAATDAEVVYEVDGADDLGGLSMKLGRCISECDGDLYLYFGAVDDVVDATGTMTGYRFFNALAGRLRNADGVGYFEMEASRHADETVDTLGSLFSHSVGGVGIVSAVD
jgi:hypothetical protein